MSSSSKKTPAEELIESLLNDVSPSKKPDVEAFQLEDEEEPQKMSSHLETVIDHSSDGPDMLNLETNILKSEQAYDSHALDNTFSDQTKNFYDATQIDSNPRSQDLKTKIELLNLEVNTPSQPAASLSINNDRTVAIETSPPSLFDKNDSTLATHQQLSDVKTMATQASTGLSESDKTLAVTGFQIKTEENIDDKVKVSVGKQSRSAGFASWGGKDVEGNLGQADNLRMAQEKILDLENENEKLRRHNEQLRAATEIIKERCDLLTSQVTEFKNDRDGLEESFKNEMTLLKNHLNRKEAELQKTQFKVDELESRLKFDMKKIRVRERELENRLELVRAEKNAVSKNKDEQILDLRRKMDTMQMEVDSYRQKCVELNKQIESSQESFKRTTRALRLAMANLELQDENKTPLKKAE